MTRFLPQLAHQAVQEAGHFTISNYDTYNQARYAERYSKRCTERYKIKEVLKEGLNESKKDTHVPSGDGDRVSPKILVEIFQQHNQSMPEVKALTSERLKKCWSRIDQAVRDGCLEQYLADFKEAVKKAQQTPFLHGEGARGWRASFDWFVANHSNIYAVLEGKYDPPAPQPSNGNGGSNADSSDYVDCDRGKLHPGEQAAVIPSIGPGSEPVCPVCSDTGWRRAEREEFIAMRECECVKAKIRAARMSAIPERSRDSLSCACGAPMAHENS